jgi:transposase
LEENLLSRTVLSSLKSLARRYQHLSAEAAALDAELVPVVAQANPVLQQVRGIGTVTAAQLLITAGENADRLKSEASFAALCGTNPIPASSGKTTRHRLNRGGDRHANSALHQIAVARITCDYIAKKRSEGKNTKEILRCLKRAIAREVFALITNPPPAADYRTLRPKRQQLGLLQVHAAAGLGVSTAKISLAARGQVHDAVFLTTYETRLNSRDLTP